MVAVTLLTYDLDNAASSTIGKDIKPNLQAMLHAEHSPIRSIMFRIEIDIPSFVSTHFVRHSATGQQHYVRSMRDDRGGTGKEDRNTTVKHAIILNAQHIIDISKRRLCSKSHKETIKAWNQILQKVFEILPELEECCMPMCEYRGGVCYEHKSCGRCIHYKEIK